MSRHQVQHDRPAQVQILGIHSALNAKLTFICSCFPPTPHVFHLFSL